MKPYLIKYISGTNSKFDPVVGDYLVNTYDYCIIYANSITDMYKKAKKELGLNKSKIFLKTIE